VLPAAPVAPMNPAFIIAPKALGLANPLDKAAPKLVPVAPAAAKAPTPVAIAAIIIPARIYLFFHAFLTRLTAPLNTFFCIFTTPLTTPLTAFPTLLNIFFMKSHPLSY